MAEEEDAAGSGRPQGLYSTSLARGLYVLSAFEHGEHALGLSEVVARTRLEKTAVLRFLATLVAAGYLRKDETARRYAPTARMLHLGSSFLRGNPLPAGARLA